MPNTFPAACDVCCDELLSNLCQIIGPVPFWSECSSDPLCPMVPVRVPVATTGSPAQTNPTNFESSGDTTIVNKVVVPELISKSFHVTNDQLNKCHKLEKIAGFNAQLFAQAIWGKINAHLIDANFTTVNVIDSVANWGPASLKKVYAQLKCTPKHLIIDPALYATVMFNTTGGCCFPLTAERGPQAYGFQSISENTYWTGADAGLMGIGFCPQAIIIVSGLPETCPAGRELLNTRNVTIPGLGLTAQFNLWFSAASRTCWGSYDIVFGAYPGIDCAGVLIIPGLTTLLEQQEQVASQNRINADRQLAKVKAEVKDPFHPTDQETKEIERLEQEIKRLRTLEDEARAKRIADAKAASRNPAVEAEARAVRR